MKKIPLILITLGLFLIFWAVSFYYYNPTIVDVESIGMLGRELKLEMSLIFFLGFLIIGIILFILGVYKLLKKSLK